MIRGGNTTITAALNGLTDPNPADPTIGYLAHVAGAADAPAPEMTPERAGELRAWLFGGGRPAMFGGGGAPDQLTQLLQRQ